MPSRIISALSLGSIYLKPSDIFRIFASEKWRESTYQEFHIRPKLSQPTKTAIQSKEMKKFAFYK
ncbi:hypothetical protein LEP1GSC188_0666 [Leptospira weilii serovar Topaz str. LT2116]|uniref:Uncharacterized protein n=1 Tax=Leptospira weilii serovar Topaz str. LT2116 TaxID=1088540 RepID=M3EEJ0_9LEPT|nr:hypothetical protein LEP1GSC188_0666 [Leptospira weilii serovar Topaz str. LT2116]